MGAQLSSTNCQMTFARWRLLGLGNVYYYRHDYDRAIVCCDQVLASDLRDAAFVNRAMANAAKGARIETPLRSRPVRQAGPSEPPRHPEPSRK
jgi:hypothetical protein